MTQKEERKKEERRKKNNAKNSGHYVSAATPRAAHALRSDQYIYIYIYTYIYACNASVVLNVLLCVISVGCPFPQS